MIRPFVLTDLNRILEIEGQAFPKSPYQESTFLYLCWLYPETFWVYVGAGNDRGKEKSGATSSFQSKDISFPWRSILTTAGGASEKP